MISNKSINISNDFAMRVFFFLMAIITSSVIGVFSQTSTPKKYTIRYEEKVRPGDASFENQKLPAKIRRSSSNKGEINFVYFDEFPDSMKVAITAAANLWESKISNGHPIYIGVCYDYLEPNVAMAADVYYYESSDFFDNLNGCPSALATQISDSSESNEDNLDGLIIFDPDIEWDCGFTDKNFRGCNLTTMTLRGIARCLGIGSSVIYFDNSFCFYNNYPTYFDNLLYYNSTYLSDIEQKSDDMANFVKSDNVYLNTASNKYKIYAPSQYYRDMSLCYLDENNSLMSYSIGQGNSFLSIDDKTIDILRTIGWDLPKTGLKIVSSDIGSNGIGSSYTSHSFHLDNENEAISNYKWKFSLKNKSNKFEQISVGNEANFTISKIESAEDYFINLDGDLEGKVECEYALNGQKYNAIPFTISLGLKPVISSIDNLKVIKQEEEHSFYVTFTITYAGAENVSVEIERDNDVNVSVIRIDEPFIAHVKTYSMSTLTYNWVRIIVRNEYGKTEKTLEFPPDIITSIDNISPKHEDVKRLQLFNINGIIVYDGTTTGFSEKNLYPGLYIKKEIYNNDISKTSKLVVL